MTEYRCIAADPPWYERGAGKIKRGADRHYDLMDPDQIIQTMLQAPCWRPAESCHLWLWATNNHLEEALFVMRALGFRYLTNAVWVKPTYGLGQYLRGQHELVLFGSRGPAMMPPEHTNASVIVGAKTEHSKKPIAFFQLAEKVSPPPRLEMFARIERKGWDSWGDEVEEAPLALLDL